MAGMLSSMRRSSFSLLHSGTEQDPESPSSGGVGGMLSRVRRASIAPVAVLQDQSSRVGGMLTNLRRASFMSLGGLRKDRGVVLPPLERRKSRRKVTGKKASVKRAQTPVLMEPHVEHTSLLLQHAVYRGDDPFKNLNSVWLGGGDKGELKEEDSDEEDENLEDMTDERREELQEKAAKKAAKEKFLEDEEARIRQLRNTALGHLTWLRGHNLGADLVPTWKVLKIKSEELQQKNRLKGPTRIGGDLWYKAFTPNSQKDWCWKGSFVNEVRFLAESQNMPLAWLNIKTAQSLFRQDPSFEQAVAYHVVAVSTDRSRYLWSHAFVQLLTVLQEEQKFEYGRVCLSPEDMAKRYPQARFPTPGKYEVVKSNEAVTIPVPPLLTRSIGKSARGAPPEPPPLPERLPCPVAYEITEPWMGIFATKAEKKNVMSNYQRRTSTYKSLAPGRSEEFEGTEDGEEANEQAEEEELENDEEVENSDEETGPAGGFNMTGYGRGNAEEQEEGSESFESSENEEDPGDEQMQGEDEGFEEASAFEAGDASPAADIERDVDQFGEDEEIQPSRSKVSAGHLDSGEESQEVADPQDGITVMGSAGAPQANTRNYPATSSFQHMISS
ncbi:unnamed protein product [Symbiodinium necroappetens]|uniref:Uncharacterized protein n=1 Tax=Symbiodinium necroappetens TaxID=1628268 RepID=A0A812T5F9_9DINO|nr:unnamed protein product [Symbiodinium necroappetens]